MVPRFWAFFAADSAGHEAGGIRRDAPATAPLGRLVAPALNFPLTSASSSACCPALSWVPPTDLVCPRRLAPVAQRLVHPCQPTPAGRPPVSLQRQCQLIAPRFLGLRSRRQEDPGSGQLRGPLPAPLPPPRVRRPLRPVLLHLLLRRRLRRAVIRDDSPFRHPGSSPSNHSEGFLPLLRTPLGAGRSPRPGEHYLGNPHPKTAYLVGAPLRLLRSCFEFFLEFERMRGSARTEVGASKVNLLGAKALPHPVLPLSKHDFNRALVPRALLERHAA